MKKDINTEVMYNFILCSYRCKDGSLLKEKYIGYRQSEAKNLFWSKYKNIM